MKIEFLPDGSPDCPLIRLYDFDAEQACRLQSLLTRLAEGNEQEVSLQQALAVETIAGCRLALQVADADHGIVPDAQAGAFVCRLRRTSWKSVAGRVSPFCGRGVAGTFQWLDETGRISWLLSPDGSW